MRWRRRLDGIASANLEQPVGDRGIGHIVTVKAKIWRNSPEKVVGARKAFTDDGRRRWRRCCAPCIIRHAGARIRQTGRNSPRDIAHGYLGSAAGAGAADPDRALPVGDGVDPSVADFFLPFAKGATFPWKSHALWFYTQMVRWGQVRIHPATNTARETYSRTSIAGR